MKKTPKNEDFDLERYQKEIGGDFKLIYDIFCSYYLSIMEGKDRTKHALIISKEQVLKTNDWIMNHVIPFYEKMEEYEKCARLKDVVEFLKKEKSI